MHATSGEGPQSRLPHSATVATQPSSSGSRELLKPLAACRCSINICFPPLGFENPIRGIEHTLAARTKFFQHKSGDEKAIISSFAFVEYQKNYKVLSLF